MQHDLAAVFTLLFLVATVVAILAQRLRVPYTVGLVLAGLTLGSLGLIEPPRLTHEFLFALVLPGLVFEAAFKLRGTELWRNRLTLALLALPGVGLAIVLTALLAPAALAAAGAGRITAGEALVFGALISATDPVAVLALFRQLGVPHRLSLLVEAESLLNDATALACFVACLALAVEPAADHGPALAAGLAARFAASLAGGALIGALAGGGAALAISRLDEPMVEVTITVVAAYGSFALADRFGVSGVLATVAAGLLCGRERTRRGMSASTRVAVGAFWDYMAFALNSLIFLLIGFEVHLGDLAAAWRPVAAAFLAVLAIRALVVGAVMLAVHLTAERLPWRWAPVLTLGGLRGALSMVLALSLPAALPHGRLLVALTFGVVTLSILGQGLTMPLLARRLGLAADTS